ncbi:thiosulfate sulfurtransferase [Marinithermofilum abyssi]|uniref:Thiosulfate sulfurtransferase n=1 Tax=Marinithermofilum abyssi TaxID=1571185 RepID=A0A8J2YA69_9BACL|nr:sulfurtransferase [Marinithermofilum abyssi]GGE07676.1 thiosulfate sulfurtransferase [Marinithermofilum abyssi]
MFFSSLVSPQWLREHLDDPDLVIADCRFDLADPEAGRRVYEAGHIPGAVYLDLERDLSGPVQEHGGRHPLPDEETLAETMGRAGIDERKKVVAYDDQGEAMAARLWWLLRYMGHDRVAILDGGFSGWVHHGYPVSQEGVTPKLTRFVPRVQSEMKVDMDEVKRHSGLLVDAREPDRYQGIREPIDQKAGHIPGAVNRFWKENLAEGQHWKSPAELKKEWDFLREEEQPILYCGSGVTACANLFALHLAGVKGGRLYPGSWSDWISYPENPIETGERSAAALRPK